MLPIGSALNAKRRRMSSKRPPPAWHAALMLKGFTEVHTASMSTTLAFARTIGIKCKHTSPASTTLNSAQLHSTPPPTTPRRTTLHHTTRTQPHAPHITHILFTHTEQWQGGYCCRNKLGNIRASCPPTPPIPHFFNVVRNGRISITRRLLLSCQINIEVHGWRGLPVFLNIFRQPTERMDSSST